MCALNKQLKCTQFWFGFFLRSLLLMLQLLTLLLLFYLNSMLFKLISRIKALTNIYYSFCILDTCNVWQDLHLSYMRTRCSIHLLKCWQTSCSNDSNIAGFAAQNWIEKICCFFHHILQRMKNRIEKNK